MTDETTTSPEVMAGDVITRPGLYESRGGDIVQITGWDDGWWVSEWHETLSWYGSDGRQRFPAEPDTDRWDLARWVAPLPASEQLAEIERQAEPLQVREGRWKTRGGKIVQVVPTDEARERDRNNGWLWMGAAASESDYWHADGTWLPARAPHDHDLLEYLGPIEPQPEPQPADTFTATADELRSEIHYLQRELGEAKAELAVVKEQLTTATAVCQQLQIELDAAQQVPADSPELRQLQLRLADMTLDRDQCKDAYDRIFADLFTIKETTKAETVEAIVEWLQPVRGCNSPSLALLLLEALPHIMRSLTGLNPEEIE